MSRRELVQNVGLAALSLLLVLGALEAAVRRFVDLRTTLPIEVRDIDWDHPLRFLPGSQHTYRSDEFTFHVAMNRFGRRDDEWSAETVADPRSLLVIGDSFVLGNGVEAPDSIPSRLEARLAEAGDRREVMNFGTPGGSPPLYRLLLEDALRDGFAARTVVVGIFLGNDFDSSVFVPRERPAPAAQVAPGWGQSSALLGWLRSRIARSSRLVGIALTLGRWLGIEVYDTTGSWIFLREQSEQQRGYFARVLAELTRMHEVAEANGRRLYAVVLPNRLQVENGAELTGRIYDVAVPDARILAWCEAERLPCLDLLPPLVAEAARSPEPLYYPADRHFTARGYAFAADRILDFLRAEGALEAPP